MATSTDHIDALLQEYLLLVDEYTRARAHLCKLQASAQLHLSRANFSAERGARYGQDYYDDRMQASRRVRIDGGEDGAAMDGSVPSPAQHAVHVHTRPVEDEAASAFNTKDPIRWFGIAAPTALRSAQRASIELVVEAVPRVVELDARLRELEIGIRRARKFHAKEVRRREEGRV